MAESESNTCYARPGARILNTVRGHAEKHPEFTEPALRNLIFFAETNGFADCILRVGRKVLIDEDEFFRCIDRLNGKNAADARRSQTNSSELIKDHSERASSAKAALSEADTYGCTRENRGRHRKSTRKRGQPGERGR